MIDLLFYNNFGGAQVILVKVTNGNSQFPRLKYQATLNFLTHRLRRLFLRRWMPYSLFGSFGAEGPFKYLASMTATIVVRSPRRIAM